MTDDVAIPCSGKLGEPKCGRSSTSFFRRKGSFLPGALRAFCSVHRPFHAADSYDELQKDEWIVEKVMES